VARFLHSAHAQVRKGKEMKALGGRTAVQALILVALVTPATPQTRQIVVSIPDHKLALVEDGEVKKVYPVATGRKQTPSPAGDFKVVNRVTNPTYYHRGKQVEPGPDNPVGTRWIGLDERGYGIHGTNAPNSIGKSASHGCIRMARRDLEEFFEMVRPGDPVSIRAGRDAETTALFASPEPAKPVGMAATEPLAHGGQ
jgi:lipoprotein-anchoring transpeptidase ErfK/SrfK